MFPIIAFSLAIAPPEPLAVAPPEPLAVALEKAVVPLLEELSTRGNESAWSFAYKDADLEVQFCAGPIKRGDSARKCHGEDTFAWGSTTKPITAVMLLQLAESGLLDLMHQWRRSLIHCCGTSPLGITPRHLSACTDHSRHR